MMSFVLEDYEIFEWRCWVGSEFGRDFFVLGVWVMCVIMLGSRSD